MDKQQSGLTEVHLTTWRPWQVVHVSRSPLAGGTCSRTEAGVRTEHRVTVGLNSTLFGDRAFFWGGVTRIPENGK